MRPALKTALFFAGSWILLKFIFLFFGVFQNEIFYSGLLNNLFLLAAIAVGLYLEKKKEGFGEGTALSDIKHAMVAGAPYTLIVSIFMFFYYQDINPSFVENRVSERMDIVYNNMERVSYVDSLKLQNQDFKVMTDEEIYNQIQEETKSAFSPKSLLTFSLLGLLILGFTYAIFVTAIYRKIMLRDYYK
ncbi:MAG: hypothetical protein WED10_15020 [Brumimicrobium sp.]